MAGEVLFFFLFPSFLLSGFKTPTSFFKFFFFVILSKQRQQERRGEGGGGGTSPLFSGRLGRSWLVLLPGSGMTMKGPPTPTALPDGIYIPCLCVITSHTLALSFHH